MKKTEKEKKKRKKIRIRIKRKKSANAAALSPEQQKKAQMRKKRRVMKVKRRFAVCAVFVFMVCGAAAVFKAPFFDVKEIVCVGQEKLSEDELIKASGVQKGKNVFLTNISEVKNGLSKIPYVSEYNARRIFPNKIKIWVRESKPVFTVKTEGKYAICDINAKVLEIADENEVGVCEILISDAPKAQTGKILMDEEDPQYKKLLECIGLLENFDMLKNTNTIDFSDISDIIIYYDGRLKIKLGSASELDYKIKFAEKVIKENISDMERATVDYTGDKLYVGPYEEEKTEQEPKEKDSEDAKEEKENAESKENVENKENNNSEEKEKSGEE